VFEGISLNAIVDDVSLGSVNTSFNIKTYATTGGFSEKFGIDDEGGIDFNVYGLGNKTGTAAYNLSVDASGNIIETANPTSTDDQIASEVPNTPSGNLVATDVQAALNELQTELDGVSGGGLANIVEDLTPQLGANLDANNFDITGLDNTLAASGTELNLLFNDTDPGLRLLETTGWTDTATATFALFGGANDANSVYAGQFGQTHGRTLHMSKKFQISDALSYSVVPPPTDLFEIIDHATVTFSVKDTGEATATNFTDSNGTTSTTGTVLDLSDNITGKIYNEATASTATAFTTTSLKTGGYAVNYVNAASQPTVGGSSVTEGGSVFKANTIMKMVVYSPDGTTVKHFYIDLGVISKPEFSKSIAIESPTATEDISMFFSNKAITVTEIRAVLIGSSTPSVTWTLRHGTDRSATGAEVVTSGTTTTSTTTGSDVTSFNDATVVADSFMWFETTAQSGTVDQILLTVIYTED
ncbi:MAG: hypothetical protein KUG81_06330, partial [Gammaproteobacteria bacterium]|nr:hypothetical protein [Gammaproteobacteria bacterium]